VVHHQLIVTGHALITAQPANVHRLTDEGRNFQRVLRRDDEKGKTWRVPYERA
jgi:hypothetical protein